MRHHLLHAITLSASALLLLAACRPIQPVLPTSADTTPVVESVGDGDELTEAVSALPWKAREWRRPLRRWR